MGTQQRCFPRLCSAATPQYRSRIQVPRPGLVDLASLPLPEP